jgi:predicted phosphodiesterase
MNWVFISDLHVGKSEERDSRIKEYLDEIRKKYPEYGLIHAGDGANDGLKEQIESFKVFLQPWQDHKKLIHVPGNHDRGWEGFEADEKCVEFWDTIFGSNWKKNRVQVHEITPHRFVAIDSTYHERLVFASCGIITDPGLIELDGQIRPGDIVLLHHNPFDQSPTMSLNDAADFFRIVENRASVVLYGHSGKYGVNVHRFGTKYWCCADESPMVGSCILLDEGRAPKVVGIL